MSFNRLDYDNGTYAHVLRESIGPGDYQLATPRVDCQGCFFPSPDVRMSGYGGAVCKDLIDVDSELMGIKRRNTKCPAEKYLPTEAPYCQATLPGKDCYDLGREDTRLSNPPCTLRGTGWNRWEWLCQDPQAKALMPFDYNINNRLVVRDNHRPCIPKPLEPTALPPQENNRVRYDWSSRCTEPFVDVTSPPLGVCEAIRQL